MFVKGSVAKYNGFERYFDQRMIFALTNIASDELK